MDVTQKHREYFAIGVRLVWLADPEAHVVSVYRSLSDVRERKEGDRLTGGDVLPGFEVPVAEIFEE
jgi:Uma2 family endonuclease